MDPTQDAAHRNWSVVYRHRDGQPERDPDPWTRLSLFQSRDLLAERYAARHGREAGDAKCREIAAHLAQGGQYFAAARGAGDLARPLLLYYGVLALARGLVLYADPQAREATLAGAHGVEAAGWATGLAGQTPWAGVPELRLGFRAGTFAELARATGNAEWTQVRWESDLVRTSGSGSPGGDVGWLAVGSREVADAAPVTVGDVLGRIPDLAFLFEETLGRPAACYPAEIALLRGPHNLGPGVPARDTGLRITVLPNRLALPGEDVLRAALGLDPAGFAPAGRDRLGRPGVAADLRTGARAVDVLPPVRVNRSWANHLVAPLPNGLVLSTLSVLFLAAYAAGMLVRYHPTAWQGMASIRRGDRAFPLLRAAVAHVEQRFPVEVADFVERHGPIGRVEELPHLG